MKQFNTCNNDIQRWLCFRTLRVVVVWIVCIFGSKLTADWSTDLEQQHPLKRPTLESRYTSSKRDGFHIEASNYDIQIALNKPGGHRIVSIQQNGALIFENGYFGLKDFNDTIWSTHQATTPSRVNLYRRGPYYHEIHWLDVAWQNEQGKVLPVKGEIIFYCYPEFFRTAVVLHPTADLLLKDLTLRISSPHSKPVTSAPKDCEGFSFNVEHAEGATALFPTIKPHCNWSISPSGETQLMWELGAPYSTLHTGRKRTYGYGLIPLKKSKETIDWNPLRAQLNPLKDDQLTLLEGVSFAFDPVRGDYVTASHNPGGFSYHYDEAPNGYLWAKTKILNNEFPRKIYLRHEVGTGSKGQVECGVVLDEANELVPILTQISKNFAGEKEEKFYNPTDTPFSEIIYPLHFNENENRTVSSLQLYQNWGNHPLKQFSSLGAWMDYYHMSTGVTETTCYVPFKYYTGISIADLRGMSGTMWTSQPQHDNVGGHLFMEYHPKDQPGKTVALEYVGTAFHSTGPDWAHLTLNYLSEDERLNVSLEAFEFPQLDELRSFIRLRLEALKDIPIADWSTDFRIMQIDTRTQRLRYQKVTWTNKEDQIMTKDIAFDGSWTLKGEELSQRAPTAVLWNSPKGNNAFIMEQWTGTIGGTPLEHLGISCEGRKNLNSNLILHPLTQAEGLVAGDVLELDFFIMPFGKEKTDFKPALIERERYGLNPVRAKAVSHCEVISSFPTRIRWTGENATFDLQGGYSTVTVQIEGLPDFKNWHIQKQVDHQWVKLPHGNPKSKIAIGGEGQQRYIDANGTFGVSFRVNLEGPADRFRIVQH